ncbi:hypothetical protein [Schaalia sp. Marseille-Q2122]|uniref:hypothetical protein n=1 Tax=Schaalia sp. Marseille-Q2122 TaxID=2736604 RepID=UPI00158D83AF|nr:hypothetical protein [Schaalia sp. Marseille-Q2122]
MIYSSVPTTQEILQSWLDDANSLDNGKVERLISMLGWRMDDLVPGAFHTALSTGGRPDGTIRVSPDGFYEVSFPVAPSLESNDDSPMDMRRFTEVISTEITQIYGPPRKRRNPVGQAVSTWTSADGLFLLRLTEGGDALHVDLHRPARSPRLLARFRQPVLASRRHLYLEYFLWALVIVAVVFAALSVPLLMVMATIVVALFPFALYSADYPLELIIPVTIALLAGYVYLMRWIIQWIRPVIDVIRSR